MATTPRPKRKPAAKKPAAKKTPLPAVNTTVLKAFEKWRNENGAGLLESGKVFTTNIFMISLSARPGFSFTFPPGVKIQALRSSPVVNDEIVLTVCIDDPEELQTTDPNAKETVDPNATPTG